MRKHFVYVIISRTPTLVGRVIRKVLDNNYNHMSLSLSADLSKIYSFGRVSARNSFAGGPLRESYYTLSLGGENDVKIAVFKLPVTKGQYDRLDEFIDNVFNDADGYVYNFAAAIATIFHRRIMVDKCYTCIEFCIDALKYAKIGAVRKLNGAENLDMAATKLKRHCIYEGEYKDFPDVFIERTENDDRFLNSRGVARELICIKDNYKKFISRSFR